MEDKVFFKPFVGKDYATGGIFGKRIMILGESHYCGEECEECGDGGFHPECTLFTQKVVADYLNPEHEWAGWKNTFLKFERSLVGHETNREERQKIWDSVMFFNFLQQAMGGPRQAGTSEQYRRSADAFYEVLDKYQPQLIIVWGKQLWNALPGDERWQEGEDVVVDGYPVSCGSYAMSGGDRATVFVVYHPSAGYSWDYWHKVIGKFV